MHTFKAQILTPEGTLFDDEASGVRVPGTTGSFEMKVHHANIISTLEVGEVLVRKADGDEQRFAITGGFVEMVDNELTLMAETAELIEDIDLERAESAKERAKERLESDDDAIDKDRAKKALERANNRINLSVDISSSMQ